MDTLPIRFKYNGQPWIVSYNPCLLCTEVRTTTEPVRVVQWSDEAIGRTISEARRRFGESLNGAALFATMLAIYDEQPASPAIS